MPFLHLLMFILKMRVDSSHPSQLGTEINLILINDSTWKVATSASLTSIRHLILINMVTLQFLSQG